MPRLHLVLVLTLPWSLGKLFAMESKATRTNPEQTPPTLKPGLAVVQLPEGQKKDSKTLHRKKVLT